MAGGSKARHQPLGLTTFEPQEVGASTHCGDSLDLAVICARFSRTESFVGAGKT